MGSLALITYKNTDQHSAVTFELLMMLLYNHTESHKDILLIL